MQDIRASLIGLVLFLAQPALAFERPPPPQVLFGEGRQLAPEAKFELRHAYFLAAAACFRTCSKYCST